MAKQFVRAGTNLVRHVGSKHYYLRCKINGRTIRENLEVKDYGAACMKRDDRLVELRTPESQEIPGTMKELFGRHRDQVTNAPHLKENTRLFYKRLFEVFEESFPLETQCRRLDEGIVGRWWAKAAKENHPTRANQMLSLLNKLISMGVSVGAIRRDPAKDLKRLRVAEKEPSMPSLEQLRCITGSIRKQRKSTSVEAARMVEWLAFSGLRIAEMRALRWQNVGETHLVVTGGAEGTKNMKMRRVPIVPPLRALIEATPKEARVGKVFDLNTPRCALTAACKREGLPHLRVHDLRHLFATLCLEAGVDFPTLARWLGHKDGGILVAKTYGHLRDEHSLSQAAKVGAAFAPGAPLAAGAAPGR